MRDRFGNAGGYLMPPVSVLLRGGKSRPQGLNLDGQHVPLGRELVPVRGVACGGLQGPFQAFYVPGQYL